MFCIIQLLAKGPHMKLKPQYMTTTVGSEMVIVPTGQTEFQGIAKGNKTFAVIVDLMREETTEEEIISALHSRYTADGDNIERGVAYVLSQLRSIGALEE